MVEKIGKSKDFYKQFQMAWQNIILLYMIW